MDVLPVKFASEKLLLFIVTKWAQPPILQREYVQEKAIYHAQKR